MKKTIAYLTLIIVFLCGYICYSMFRNKLIENQLSSDVERYFSNNIRQNNILKDLKVISKLQYFAEGKRFKNIKLFTSKGDSIYIKSLCLKEKKLIFFLSEQTCQICYKPYLKKLSDLYRSGNIKNVILIGKFQNDKDLKLIKNDFKIGFDIYQIKDDIEIFPEYNDYALSFLLSDDMKINNVYISDKSNGIFMDDYLKIIESNLLN